MVALDDCAVTGSTANFDGGGLLGAESYFLLTRTILSRNEAAGNGGGAAAAAGGGLGLLDCVVAHNSATEGGGLYVDASVLSVNSSNVTRNAADYGGGVGALGTGHHIFDAAWVERNVATDGGGVAIEDGSAFFAAGSSVSRNEALSRGGGLCVDSASVALGSDFRGLGNVADSQGGFAALWNDAPAIYGASDDHASVLAGNVASEGGAVDVVTYATGAAVRNIVFLRNEAESGVGAAIHVSLGAAVAISNCKSGGHYSKSSGASIYLASGAEATVIDFESVGDQALLRGIIYLEHDTSFVGERLTVRNASVVTGVIFATDVTYLYLGDSHFAYNSAEEGSCVYAELCEEKFVLARTTVERNEGSAVFLDGSHAHLENVTIRDNVASPHGEDVGAAGLATVKSSIFMKGSTIERNEAEYGGAFAVTEQSSVFSYGGNAITGNAAVGGHGGAFLVLSSSVVVLREDDAVDYNTATLGGGVAYWDSTTVDRANLVTFATIGANNDAGYGPVNATGITAVRGYHDGVEERSNFELEDDLVVEALDYFGQVAAVGATTFAVALYEGDDDTSFNGLNSKSFTANGPAIARWRNSESPVVVGYAPNRNATLVAVLDPANLPEEMTFDEGVNDAFEDRFPVWLRGCEMGEELVSWYGDDDTCQPCGVGFYWFDRGSDYGAWATSGRCKSCENGMICETPGRSIVDVAMEESYYRTKSDSRHVYSCPSEAFGCPGHANATSATGTTGGSLCAEGYGGILCATCRDGYYGLRDSHNRYRCYKCKSKNFWQTAALYVAVGICTVGGCVDFDHWFGWSWPNFRIL